MYIHRFFRRRFPPRSKTRAVAFLFGVLLISGCGGEESMDTPLVETVRDARRNVVAPISTIYYPMTPGNRWVYQNPDGSEWTQEVTNAGFLDAQQFAHSFSHNPIIEESTLNFFRVALYIATPDRIVRPIKTGEIGTAARQEIDIPITIRIRIVENNGNTVRRFGFFGPFTYTIDRLERSDFTFLRPPLVPGKTWQVFSIGRRGSRHVIHTSFSHVLEVHSLISARINEELQTVLTPAGRFEDCLEIEYYETRSAETTEIEIDLIPEKYREERAFLIAKIHETVATEFLKLIPNVPLGTLWLAPGVGPVKMEDTSGTSELIAYDVKQDND